MYSIEEREELLDTLNKKNDTLRLVYRISCGDETLASEDTMKTICTSIIEDEWNANCKAMAFFFWPYEEADLVGKIAATVSMTYAPGGVWEAAMSNGNKEEMKLITDFNSYKEA